MKNKVTAVIVVTLFCMALVAACGSATSNETPAGSNASSGGTDSNTTSADNDISEVAQSPVPEKIKSSFGSCSDYKPSPLKKGESIAGGTATYDEVLAEEDWGGEFTSGTKIQVNNIAGFVWVYGNTDADKTSWGVKKWALAETIEDAKKGVDNIKISAGVKDGEAKIIVNHPDNSYPGTRYQTCVVVNVPASWAQSIKNINGDVDSSDSKGAVKVLNDNGNVYVEDAADKVEVENQNGSVIIGVRPSSTTKVSNGAGSISYHLLENTPLVNDSSLDTKNGNINIIFNVGTGAKLDALVDTGLITAPDLPAPEIVDTKGQHLVTDVNGGGAKLTAHSETGKITVELLKPQQENNGTE